MPRRLAALFVWAYGFWLLLTWTATFEQLVAGGVVAAAVAIAFAPVGEVAGPWRLLDPRLWPVLVRLAAGVLTRIVRANLWLVRTILTPHPRPASGMVVVATRMRSDAGLAGTGLVSSLIVDNQIVDLDRRRHQLQYHTLQVPTDVQDARERINGPVEDLLAPMLAED